MKPPGLCALKETKLRDIWNFLCNFSLFTGDVSWYYLPVQKSTTYFQGGRL